MTFIDKRLPEKYALQAVATDDWQAEIVVALNRRESRNLPSENPRLEWDLSVSAKTSAEREELRAWFMAMNGPIHSFAFRDPGDHCASRGQIGVGDGTTKTFQLTKAYAVGSATYIRPITRPIVASVGVWVNGIEQSSGWSAGRTTGGVTFTVAPAGSAIIEAACEFDVPVRFLQSRLSWRRVDRNPSRGDLWMCDAMNLIEVIGE